MRWHEIMENTTSGAVATMALPLGAVQRRQGTKRDIAWQTYHPSAAAAGSWRSRKIERSRSDTSMPSLTTR